MPSTKTHDGTCLALATTQLVLGYTLHPYFYLSAAGSFLGLLISPDWDWIGYIVVNPETEQSRLTTNLASLDDLELIAHPVIGKVARRWPKFIHPYLLFYAAHFEHRGISHSPIGTLIRLLWLIWPIPLVYFIPLTIYVWIGLFVADLGHILLDFHVSDVFKRKDT